MNAERGKYNRPPSIYIEDKDSAFGRSGNFTENICIYLQSLDL